MDEQKPGLSWVGKLSVAKGGTWLQTGEQEEGNGRGGQRGAAGRSTGD